MARKRRAVECVSYLDEDPYEEADEKSLMIDLNAETDRGSSNKSRQAGGLKKEPERGLCNGGNGKEVQQLRAQLKEERREHRRALLDIRTLIDRHIAKVSFPTINLFSHGIRTNNLHYKLNRMILFSTG